MIFQIIGYLNVALAPKGFLCSSLNLPFEKLIAFYFPYTFFYPAQIIIGVIIYGLILFFSKDLSLKLNKNQCQQF